MKDVVCRQRITRYVRNSGCLEMEDLVVSEQALTVYLNGSNLVTLLCTPAHLHDLTVGYLASEGFIDRWEDIKTIELDKASGEIRVDTRPGQRNEDGVEIKRYLTTGCGKGVAFGQLTDPGDYLELARDYRTYPESILNMMKDLLDTSGLHRETGGVHTAALGGDATLLLKRDDIGRHNAVDKVLGHCIRHQVKTGDKVLVISGRISAEIVLKTAKRGMQLIISKSAPTDMAIDIADRLGLTLVGFARGNRFNIYTHPYRVLG